LLPDLVNAIAVVANGACYLCPCARRTLLFPTRLPLSPRQQEIASAVAVLKARDAHVTVHSLADYLHISPKTVYAHLYQIGSTLRLSSSVEQILKYLAQVQL
jgi:DNA-binding NarL/FixJ family response regulator